MQGIPLKLDMSSLLESASLDEVGYQLKLLATKSIYFAEFSKRQFHNPRGYVQWEKCITELAFNLIASDNVEPQMMDYASINSSVLLRNIYENSAQTFPCYWLDANLLQAFLNTDLPDFMGIKRSQQYGIIFLPQNTLHSPDGYSVNWIVFAHRLKGEVCHTWFPAHGWVTQNYTEDMLQIFTALGQQNILYFSGCSLSRTDDNGLPYREKQLFLDQENNAQAERDFVDQLLSITMQCLLWLQLYQPTESTPSGVGFGAAKSQKSQISHLKPRWIGQGYQPKYSSRYSHSNKSTERQSPRTHWRRGHWRSQRFGQGKLLVKTIWIEPTLVGG
jgi:hypothetical protein